MNQPTDQESLRELVLFVWRCLVMWLFWNKVLIGHVIFNQQVTQISLPQAILVVLFGFYLTSAWIRRMFPK